MFCIHNFHIDHNAPCLPPKIMHNNRDSNPPVLAGKPSTFGEYLRPPIFA